MSGSKLTRWVPLNSATRIQVQCLRQNCLTIVETLPGSLHNLERCPGCTHPFTDEQLKMVQALGNVLVHLASQTAEQDEYTDKEFGIRFWADGGETLLPG